MKQAIIITIGDEILIGQIVDTNSAWIAERMTMSGFEVLEIISIADREEEIMEALDYTLARVDIVITTGGIGPTKDDITKHSLCKYFDTQLVFNSEVYENVKSVVADLSKLNKLTEAQASVPESANIIQNRVGTAPITWFEKDAKILVSLPSVPYEMKYNIEHEVMPRLQKKFQTSQYLKKNYMVAGYTESSLAIRLEQFEASLEAVNIGLAYLPSPSIMKLRLYARGNDMANMLAEKSKELEALLGNAILANEDIKLEEILGNILRDKKLTLSTAESCTGGNIAHLITSISGSSAYFEGSIVSYSNIVKEKNLSIAHELIAEYGAESKEVVTAMANNIQKAFNTDCAIAVSGIAGPTGGTEDKPVGTTWIATKYKDNLEVKLYRFGEYRQANIMRASNNAIIQLIRMLPND